jgi:tripartite ATP-independent transporter DctP family solute receptor
MVKRFISITALVLMWVVASSASLAAKEAVVIKWGHTNAPGMASYDAPLLFAKKVEELSKGRVVCKVFPQSQLGGERDLIESVKMGTVQVTSPSIAPITLSYPRIGVYELPFLFKDPAHILRVAQGPTGQKIAMELEKKTGLKILDYFCEGGRGLYNNSGPVYNPEDMKGKKIRIMESEMYRDMFSAVGALPTPLPFAEVYAALATKLVDFADPDIANFRAMKHYEVCKYYTFTDHVMIFKPVLTSDKFFNQLTPEDQSAVKKAMEIAAQFQRERDAALQKENIAWLEKQGIKINTANKAAFREKMTVVYDKARQRLGKEFVDEVVKAASE